MEIIVKSLIISLAIVGLRIVSSKGMVLHFLRMPFEDLTGWKQYIMKPLILCGVCMSSVYTFIISHFFLGGITKYTFLSVFIVAGLVAIIYSIYEKLSK